MRKTSFVLLVLAGLALSSAIVAQQKSLDHHGGPKSAERVREDLVTSEVDVRPSDDAPYAGKTGTYREEE